LTLPIVHHYQSLFLADDGIIWAQRRGEWTGTNRSGTGQAEKMQGIDVNIVQAIQKYHDSSTGYAWGIFWDYKCETEEDGDNIFSDSHILMTSLHLFVYLTCFGMTRPGTRLIHITVHDFAEILRGLGDSYNPVKDVRFEALESHREHVTSLFKNTLKILDSKKVRPTITMITKILLAAWGQTPAYDSRFRLAYKKAFPGQRIPSSLNSVFDSLLFLKEQYCAKWAEEVAKLPDKTRRTRPDGKYKIPPARLVDMAFWQDQYEQQKEGTE
jgi:hypothetical protein